MRTTLRLAALAALCTLAFAACSTTKRRMSELQLGMSRADIVMVIGHEPDRVVTMKTDDGQTAVVLDFPKYTEIEWNKKAYRTVLVENELTFWGEEDEVNDYLRHRAFRYESAVTPGR